MSASLRCLITVLQPHAVQVYLKKEFNLGAIGMFQPLLFSLAQRTYKQTSAVDKMPAAYAMPKAFKFSRGDELLLNMMVFFSVVCDVAIW